VVAKRAAILALAAALACGPLLAATLDAAEPSMSIEPGGASLPDGPDLVQFVMPPTFSAWFGPSVTSTLARWQVTPATETEVSVPLVALALIGAALVSCPSRAAVWIAVAIAAVVLSLGPTFHAFGVLHDGITLPYSWLTALPGFGFLRTPARFMEIAFVAIAAAAAIGLDEVTKKRPSAANALVATASLLLLVQVWPGAWPTETLPPTPSLYTSLAGDKTMFGVLDLPVRPSPDMSPYDYSARYQAYQMLHKKGIAAGYVSRTYARHPVSPCIFADDRAPADVRVDGVPSRCEPAAIHQLAAAGYRYVVWHKPSEWTLENLPGSWADADARMFVESAFGVRPPAVDDVLVRAWMIPQGVDALPTEPVVELGAEWYPAEPDWRWATSPATLIITAPRRQEVELTVSVPLLHDRSSGRALGRESVLIATLGDQTVSRPVAAGDVVRFPLSLDAGAQTVSIALGAGNFTPSDYGETDARRLSFAVKGIDLLTAGTKK